MALKEGRNNTKHSFFRNSEMENQFIRTMAAMPMGGAEIGECLIVKAQTKDGDLDSFSDAWHRMAMAIEVAGDKLLKSDKKASAKKNFLRASNYYRSAMTCLSPLDPRHFENWKKAKACFHKAGSLFEPGFKYLQIPFENGFLPCYLLHPSNIIRKLPTLIVVTGGEGTAMEMYFWCAPEGLAREYNILLCELPGNISTRYGSPDLTLRADMEVPIRATVDYLETIPSVDTSRIAILGYSAGGYFAARAAAFEKRIAALIPDSPLRDMHGMFTAVFPKIFLSPKASSLIQLLIQLFADRATKASIDLVLWESGVDDFGEFIELTKQADLTGLEEQITCPTLALSSEGEGAAFLNQSKLFVKNISSITKEERQFTHEEGAGAHCQINNLTLANDTIFDWLDGVFQRNN